jgi:hypothetical protein
MSIVVCTTADLDCSSVYQTEERRRFGVEVEALPPFDPTLFGYTLTAEQRAAREAAGADLFD